MTDTAYGMGRFGPLDGAILLGLQLAAVSLALWCCGRRRLRESWLPALASYCAAFAAHIAAFAAMRSAAPELYADSDARRPWVALTWALSSGLTLLLWRRGVFGKTAALLGALLAAAAYYAFVVLRG